MQTRNESGLRKEVPQARGLLSVISALAGAILSGVLVGLSVPPNGLWGLAFVALAPLYASALYVPNLVILLQGLICGFVAGLTVFLEFPSDFWLEFLYFLMFGYAVAITAMFARWRGRLDRLSDVGVVGAVGVLMEFCFQFIEVPISFALAISRDFPLLQLAGITGIWGLSFLLWATSASVAGAYLHKRLTPALKGMSIALLVLHIGGYLSTLITPSPTSTLRIAVVQPHYAPYVPLLKEAKQQGAELVIFPETSTVLSDEVFVSANRQGEPPANPEKTVPLRIEQGRYPPYRGTRQGVSNTPRINLDESDATRLAQRFQVALIAGHLSGDYNCASLVLPDSKVLGTYKKMYPFGSEKYSIKRGERALPFETEWGKIGVVICYDTMFSRPVRETVRAGAQLVAVPTNDPTAPRYAVHHLHSSMALIRSAEHRVPVVVSENNGLSTITDRYGRMLWQAGAEEQVVRTMEIALTRSGTLYTWLGDYMVILCALVILLALSRRL